MNLSHKTVNTDNQSIHYCTVGNCQNPPLILIHPAFSDYRIFNEQFPDFSKGFYVIAIDLVGHGLSQIENKDIGADSAPDFINKIIEKENLTRVNILGVSFGSLIAQYFALNNSEKILSMVLLGSYNINSSNKEIEKEQKSINLKLMLRLIFSLKSFRKYASKVTAYTKNGQKLFYHSSEHFTRKSILAMKGLKTIIKDRNNIQQDLPLLLINGQYDNELALKMAKQWHSLLNNSRFEIIENAGHCANVDNPIMFNNKVLNFLEEFNTK